MQANAFERFVGDKLFQCAEYSFEWFGCSNLYILSAAKIVGEKHIKIQNYLLRW